MTSLQRSRKPSLLSRFPVGLFPCVSCPADIHAHIPLPKPIRFSSAEPADRSTTSVSGSREFLRQTFGRAEVREAVQKSCWCRSAKDSTSSRCAVCSTLHQFQSFFARNLLTLIGKYDGREPNFYVCLDDHLNRFTFLNDKLLTSGGGGSRICNGDVLSFNKQGNFPAPIRFTFFTAQTLQPSENGLSSCKVRMAVDT